MSTPVGELVEGPPDWSPVPEPKASRRAVIARVISRALVGGAVAVVLWSLDHRFAAVALATVLVLVTLSSLLLPSVARRIDQATRAVQRVAGRLLAFVLLGAVQLLVFTPISLLMRLVGRDPLSLGSSRDDATFWRPRAGSAARPLYRRPFTHERGLSTTPGLGRSRLPFQRLRAVVGLVALLLLADIGAGLAINALDLDLAATEAGLLTAPDAPAGRHEPWRGTLSEEIFRAWSERRYDPFLAWRIFDFHGKHLNVDGGVRRSYEQAGPMAKNDIQVFFFGGSAMFGLFQRDQHTIPSEVARLAAADGIRIRVANYAQPGYLNWQEVLLLEQLVTGKSVPDLAVFYDGVNDVGSQFGSGLHFEPSHFEAHQQREEREASPFGALYDAWAEVSALKRVGDRLRRAVHPGGLPGNPGGARPEDLGAGAALLYARGQDLARRLARGYGFRATFFWQPILYSKRVVPGERQIFGADGEDPQAWRRADYAARSRLDPSVNDLSKALDGVETPVMYDWSHTNELGAKEVARALYKRLRPTLRRLVTERSS